MKHLHSNVPTSIKLSALAMVALCLLATSVRPMAGTNPTTGQDARRPNIEANSRSATDSATTLNTRLKSPPPTPRKRATPHRKLPADYAVTFMTNAPDAEFQVDGEPLGKAGKDGKLATRIKPGRHNVTVSHPQFRNLTKPIEMGPGLSELYFRLDEIPKPVAAKETPPPVVTSEPPKPTVSAESVLKKFVESARPDEVTADEWKEVQVQSEKALAREPGNNQIKTRLLFAHGQRAYLQGEYTLALVAFNEASQTVPDFSLAYYGAGNAYLSTNLIPDAIRAFQRSVQGLPGFALGHKALGDALTKSGNRKEANESYARARDLGYSGPELGLAMSQNLMTDQKWYAALDELKVLVEKHPSAEAYLLIGECHEGLRNEFSAAIAFGKSLDLDANSAIANFKLGMILLNHHEYISAKEALEKAAALDQKGDQINVNEARKSIREISSKLRK